MYTHKNQKMISIFGETPRVVGLYFLIYAHHTSGPIGLGPLWNLYDPVNPEITATTHRRRATGNDQSVIPSTKHI
jgi:hypothetical protein